MAISTAVPCTLCPVPSTQGLIPDHPRALEIAVRTRKAVEEGTLTARAQLPTVMFLRAWAASSGESFDSILLVDTGKLLELRSGPGGVIISTSHTLSTLVVGQMQLEDAIQRGLVILETPTDERPPQP